MLADPKIPIGMTDPCDIQIILKPKRQIQIGSTNQFVKDYAIIDSLDPHFAPIAVIEQLAATSLDFGHANRANTKQCFRRREIDTRFLSFRLDLQKDYILRSRIGDDRAP